VIIDDQSSTLPAEHQLATRAHFDSGEERCAHRASEKSQITIRPQNTRF
jgi:hypothetical protein